MTIELLPVRKEPEVLPTAWPFGDHDDPLIKAINKMVAKELPEDLRNDICQEIAVALLAEEINEVTTQTVLHFTKVVMRWNEWKFRWVSLDVPINNESDTTWREML